MQLHNWNFSQEFGLKIFPKYQHHKVLVLDGSSMVHEQLCDVCNFAWLVMIERSTRLSWSGLMAEKSMSNRVCWLLAWLGLAWLLVLHRYRTVSAFARPLPSPPSPKTAPLPSLSLQMELSNVVGTKWVNQLTALYCAIISIGLPASKMLTLPPQPLFCC